MSSLGIDQQIVLKNPNSKYVDLVKELTPVFPGYLKSTTKKDFVSRYENYSFPIASVILPEIQYELDNRKINRNWQDEITPFLRVTPGHMFDGDEKNGIFFEGFESTFEDLNKLHTDEYRFNDIYKADRFLRPRAGLTGLIVSYKNVYGSVRKAILSWQCHTLFDLENLAPYMMNPGKSMFIEWGWSGPQGISQLSSEEELFKNNPKNSEDLNVKTHYKRTIDAIINSSGNYDSILGIITNFSYSLNRDGSFNCTTEVMSLSVIMEGLDAKNDLMATTFDYDTNEDTNKTNTTDAAKKNDDTVDLIGARTLKDSVFKLYNMINKDKDKFQDIESDETITGYSDIYITDLEPKDMSNDVKKALDEQNADIKGFNNGNYLFFVSWGYIEDYIINSHLRFVHENSDSKVFMFDSRKSRISSNPEALRSNDPYICLIPCANKEEYIKNTNVDKNSLKTKKLPAFESKYVKNNGNNEPQFSTPRHILVNLNFLIKCINENDKLIDIVTAVFSGINAACLNYWDFQIREYSPYELYDVDNQTSAIGKNPKHISDISLVPDVIYSIVDNKFYNKSHSDSMKDSYLFNLIPMTTKIKSEKSDNTNISNADMFLTNSIVRDIQFASSLSNEMAMSVFYSAQKVKDHQGAIGKNHELFYKLFRSDRNSSDRFNDKVKVHINTKSDPENEQTSNEEVKQHAANRKQKGWESFPDLLKFYLPIFNYGYAPYFGKDVDQENEIYKRFLLEEKVMYEALFNNWKYKSNPNNQGVLPIKIELTLDGISGIKVGNIFRLDYVPEMYRKNCIFQVINVEHSIDRNMWITKIVAIVRVFHNIITTSNDKSETTISQVEKKPTVIKNHNLKLNIDNNKEKYVKQVIAVWTDDSILGWKTYEGSPLMETMLRVVTLESSWNPHEHNTNPPDDSYGLFQINMYGKLRASRLNNHIFQSLGIDKNKDGYGLFDPVVNAKIAKALVWARGFILKGIWSTLKILDKRGTLYYQHAPEYDFSRYVIWGSMNEKQRYQIKKYLLPSEVNCKLSIRQKQKFHGDS